MSQELPPASTAPASPETSNTPATPAATPAAVAAPAPAPAEAPAEIVDIDYFLKVKLRVARIESAEPVPKSKKLMKLRIF